MRVILDANVLVSFLLKPDSGSSVTEIIHGATQGLYLLLLPPDLLESRSRGYQGSLSGQSDRPEASPGPGGIVSASGACCQDHC